MYPQLRSHWKQTISLLSNTTLGIWYYDLLKVRGKGEGGSERKISSIAWIFRWFIFVHVCSCLFLLCRLWYLEGCAPCGKLPRALELNALSWSSLDRDFFCSFICLPDEIQKVFVRDGTKKFCIQCGFVSFLWYDLYRPSHSICHLTTI